MTNEKNSSQEIDLIELFANIWNWISYNIKSLLYFSLRNAGLFMIAGALSVVFAIVAYKSSTPFYKSELLALSHTISNNEVIQSVNNWNYQKEFSEADLKNIKNISAQYLLDLNNDGIWDIVEEGKVENVRDTVLMNKRIYGAFCISAELYDTSLVSIIRTKVFNYLENKKRVVDINNIRIQQRKAMLPKLQKEINDLDSLKYLQYFEERSKNGKAQDLMILNEKELKLFHNDLIRLYSQQQKIEKELFLSSDPFEIFQDFTLPRFQENSLTHLLIIYIKSGLLLGFLIILLWDRRAVIKKLIKDSRQ